MGRPPLSRDVQVSKKIAWLLRHGAEKEGLQLSASGFANVQDVLGNRNVRSFKATFQELYSMVQSNDKKRFSIVPAEVANGNANGNTAGAITPFTIDATTAKPSDYLIRANQGHSVAVDTESLLTKIDADSNNIPSVCVHGTTHGAWPLIVATGGLKAMTRRHVHFASGLPSGFSSIADETHDAPVISGMRNSSTVLIYLDVVKAMDGGLKFWLSENGVILTEGNADGIVPLAYFKHVEDRTGGQGVLVTDGQMLKEHPRSWESKGTGHGPGGRKKGKPSTAREAQQS